jgi:two-component system sensor histidine kinase AlgZ
VSSPAAASSGPPSPGLHSATHAGLASTWRALAEARRAVPITLVCSALLATEYLTTRSLPALLTLLGFLVAFVLLVPAAWRWVERGSRAPARGLAYGLLCVSLVALTTVGLPPLLGFEPYVAHPPAAAAILTLAAMAGFILGRDIDLSAGLIMAEQRSSELLREAENARLLALRQHLDPHFLFNTLGAIAEWCREDPLVAERALLELSTMLRTLFDGIRTPLWPIAREVEVLLALQRLYALRDDERYPLNTDLSGLSSADMVEIPPLVLLPLFENALTHGAPRSPLVAGAGGHSRGARGHALELRRVPRAPRGGHGHRHRRASPAHRVRERSPAERGGRASGRSGRHLHPRPHRGVAPRARPEPRHDPAARHRGRRREDGPQARHAAPRAAGATPCWWPSVARATRCCATWTRPTWTWPCWTWTCPA